MLTFRVGAHTFYVYDSPNISRIITISGGHKYRGKVCVLPGTDGTTFMDALGRSMHGGSAALEMYPDQINLVLAGDGSSPGFTVILKKVHENDVGPVRRIRSLSKARAISLMWWVCPLLVVGCLFIILKWAPPSETENIGKTLRDLHEEIILFRTALYNIKTISYVAAENILPSNNVEESKAGDAGGESLLDFILVSFGIIALSVPVVIIIVSIFLILMRKGKKQH